MLEYPLVDIHNHILPGLDDGAKTLDDSLEMAQIAFEQGTQSIIATPHVNRDTYFYKDPEIINTRVEDLKSHLKEQQINLELYGGAEVHFTHNIIREINEFRNYLVLNKSSYLLVEFPSDHIFSGAENVFFDLMCEGIIPVIAHPERNNIFVNHPDRLYELIRSGALSQVNSGSFVGLYGDMAADAVFQYMELGLVHFIASDSHSPRSLKTFNSDGIEAIAEVFGKATAKSLVYENPLAIIKGEKISYVPDPKDPKKHEKSLKIKLPRFMRKRS